MRSERSIFEERRGGALPGAILDAFRSLDLISTFILLSTVTGVSMILVAYLTGAHFTW